jgi:hypothetical protein
MGMKGKRQRERETPSDFLGPSAWFVIVEDIKNELLYTKLWSMKYWPESKVFWKRRRCRQHGRQRERGAKLTHCTRGKSPPPVNPVTRTALCDQPDLPAQCLRWEQNGSYGYPRRLHQCARPTARVSGAAAERVAKCPRLLKGLPMRHIMSVKPGQGAIDQWQWNEFLSCDSSCFVI